MAKKKRTRKRRKANTTPDTGGQVDKRRTDAAESAPKKRKRRRPKPEVEEPTLPSRDHAEHDREESHSLPPTKKSNLPPELAHDDREIDASAIKRFSGIVLLMTLAAMILVWFLDGSFTASEKQGHEQPGPMASSIPTAPAGPKLQRLPLEGLAELHAKETQELENYGWVDKRRGVVRVPISRAIDLLSERGLPTRTKPYDDAPALSQPTESSLTTPSDEGDKR